jgi:outer membrane protein TolC
MYCARRARSVELQYARTGSPDRPFYAPEVRSKPETGIEKHGRQRFVFIIISWLLAIIVSITARAQAPAGPEAPSSTAVQLPLSGRTSETGSVGTTQSVVNPGGTNSVNYIDSSVNVQGPYFGSMPTGKATEPILPLSLEEAIRRGLKYNLGTFGFTQGIRQARGERYVLRSNLMPNLNANLREVVEQIDLQAFGFPSNIPGIPQVVGPFNYFDLRATLTQTVADLTALRNYRAAGQIEKAAILLAKDARDQVVLAVGGSYLQVIAASARVDAAEARVRTAQAVYDQAVSRHEARVNARIDVTRTLVELQTEQQRLRGLQNDVAKLKLNVARIIGLPIGQDFELTDSLPYTPLEGITQEQALQHAYQHRADFQSAAAQVRAAEMAHKAATAERLPSLLISLDYGAIGINPSNSHGTFTFVGTLRIPIFQGGRVIGDVLEADAALEQRRAELEDIRGRIDYDVRNAFLDLQTAFDQFGAAKSNVGLALETLQFARDRFSAGVTDTVEVVQAQESVASADNDLISATYSYNLAKVSLARAVGQAEQGIRQFLPGR